MGKIDKPQHTNTDRLILAANTLHLQKTVPFTAYDLAIAAWERWPSVFSMPGHGRKHPDSHKIFSMLSGKGRGLVDGRKVFVRMDIGKYQLSELGLQCAKDLANGHVPDQHRLREINGHIVKVPDALKRLIDSEAASLDRDGKRAEISFAQALTFFGGFQDKEATKRQLVEVCESDLDCAGQARALKALAEHLEDRFGKHFTLLQKRYESGKRKG